MHSCAHAFSMGTIELFFAALLLAAAPGKIATQGVDLTLQEGTSGITVVAATLARIRQTEIFSNDNEIVRRIAYVETRDGMDADTYRAGYHGGIWAVDQTLFQQTQNVASYPSLTSLYSQINAALGIDWSSTQWSELRKPLYSALAARIYLHTIPETIPIAIQSQADYWQRNYNPSGSTSAFVAAVNELGAADECSVSGIDLYFVLDSSGSVGFSNFQLMKSFAYDVTNGFDIGADATQVGVMSFDSSPRFHFYLNTYHSKSSLLSAINDLFYNGGGTNTAAALDSLRLNGYTSAHGGRPSSQAIPRVAVVVTDGFSNSFSATVSAASAIHAAGITVFAVGVGGNVNTAELNAIASDPAYVSLLTGFDTSQFDALQMSINSEACTVSADVEIATTVSDTVGNGETKYFEYPFPDEGLTLQVDVDQGSAVVYASDLITTPNEALHDWRVETDGYTDVFLDPGDLERPAGDNVYVSIEGIESTNTFTIDTTYGDTSTSAPDTPSSVQITSIGTTTASVTWQPPVISNPNTLNSIVSYQLLLTDTQLGVPNVSVTVTTTSYTFMGLEEFNTYTCQVAATSSRGTGDYSSPVNFTTSQASPSAPPQNISGSNLTISIGITLSWSPPPAIDINGVIQYYNVEVTEVYTGNFWRIIAVETHINIGPLHPYYVYECRISAYTVGDGPFSAPFQVLSPETEPTASPQNVTVTNVTTHSISLLWYPPPYEYQNGLIRQYRIRVHQIETGITTEVTSNTTSVTVDGLLPFYNYTCAVAAETIGVGPHSLEIHVELPEDIPSAPPRNVNGSAINSTSILIYWEPPALENLNGFLTGYLVNVTETETGQIFLLSSSTTSIFLSSLHPSYTYECRVSAVTVGDGPFSTEIVIKTDETAPSSPPEDFVATATSSRSVYITWDPPPPEDQNGEIIRYIINVTVQETGETFQLYSETNSLSVDDLRPYTTYICVIAAVTNAGVGPFSITFAVETPEDLPSVPQNPSVFTRGGFPMELLVTWEPPAEANGILTSFSVYCNEKSFGSGFGSGGGMEMALAPDDDMIDISFYVVVSGNRSEAIAVGLTPFTDYECLVTANTSVGESNTSISVSARTDESVPGDPPRDFEAAVINSTAVYLSWSQPLFPYGIIILYQITYNDSGDYVMINSSSDNGDNFIVTGLEEYTQYEIEVAASTRIGFGPVVTVVVRTDPAEPASSPVDVQSVVTSSRSVTVTWMPPPAIDQNGPIAYYILVIEDRGFNTNNVFINTTLTSYTFTDLEEFNNYSCIVAAATSVGVGPYGTPIEFTTLQDVPSAAPQTLVGFAQSTTVIFLTWQPPPAVDANGIIRYYVAEIRELETGRFWDFIAVDEDLQIGSLHPYYNYECTVAAFTIGTGPYTNSIAVLTDEAVPSASPSALSTASVTSESFTLMWQPPPFEETNGIIRNYVITVTEVNTGQTFTETSNTTQVTLVDLHPFYMYECQVAAETVGLGPYSTQIIVQLDEEAPTAPPGNLSGYPVDSRTISLSWSPPPIEEQNGIVRHYIINVTERDTGDTFIATAFGTDITLQALHPFYVYEITIVAVTIIGPGPMSPVFFVQTIEDAPSSPPVNPAASETSATITLTWDPPEVENQNGIITGYVVIVTVMGTGENFQRSSTTNSLTVVSLRPYTTYVCAIAAETSAGVGPFSITIIVQTDEASPASPPENVMATAPSSTSISFTWSPPPTNSQNGVIREYRINITEVETGGVSYHTSTTTSIAISSLHPYYTYNCTITAYTVGTGPYTEVVTVRTLEDVPSGYPQSFLAEATSSRSALITWDPPLASEQNGVITGYIINVTEVETGDTFQLLSQGNSLTVDRLSPFTTYLCVIAATTSVGTGPFSTVFILRTPEDVPTASPLNPMGAVVDSRTISLSWDPPPVREQNGIVRVYQIEITEVETGIIWQQNSSSTSIVVSSLHPFYNYNWIVSAYTIGEGPYTNVSAVRTIEDIPSGSPENFSGHVIGPRNILLTWNLPLAEDRNGIITGYVINVNKIGSGEIQQFFTSLLHFNVSHLTAFTEYLCIVAANTSVGQGPFSVIIRVMTEEEPPGSHPSNTSGIALNSTHIHLTWDPPDDPNGVIHEYRINVSELETGNIFYFTSEITEITIGSLHPFYVYNCTIVAVNIAGQGPYSAIITLQTLEDAPSGPPINLQVQVEDHQTLFLSWEPPLPEERNGIVRQYNVIVTSTTTSETIPPVTTAATTLRVSGLAPFTFYTCSVGAHTIATGPAAQSSPVQTDPFAPTAPPQELVATILSPRSLLLTWLPPISEHTNGIIMEYVVIITEIQTGNTTQLITENQAITIYPLHPYYTYRCTVAAETVNLGPFTPPLIVEMPEDVPASPPRDVSASMITSTSFLLSWREPPPEDHNGIIRHYRVSVFEENTGLEFLQQNTTTAATEILLENLHPHYEYTCRVAAVTVGSGPYSAPVTANTTMDPPSGSPTNVEVMVETSTSITVSWEPPVLENQNGVISGYIIRITSASSGESEELQSNTTTATVDSLQPFTSYTIAVAAQTSAGTGPFSLELVVRTQEDAPTAPPDSVMHLVLTSTSVTLTWNSPPSNETNGEIRHYVLFVIEEDTERNFTLTSTVTELVVGNLHPFYTYRFAVSAFTVAAGPYTQQYTIQTEQDVPSVSPQSFESLSEDSRTLILAWEPPPLEEQNGIIVEYRINVTVSETGDMFQLTSDALSLRVTNLHPYYTYHFIITAVTVIGPGPFSRVYSVQMPQDVPSAAPQNTMGETLSSTAITIIWEAPELEEQNGIIISFNISLLEVPTNATFTYQQAGLHTELVINSLHPYYEYSCSVAAATEIGVGPFSTPFVIRTDGDVPTASPRNVEALTENSTAINLIWEPPPPEHQNGLIEEYHVTVTVEETREQFQLTSTTTALIATGLHPYYTYSFSIAAVTAAGMGPFSEPARNQTFEDVPIAPPQNVAGVAVSSSSIRLSWAAPPSEHQNGMIRSYIITITETETERILEYETHGEDTLLIVNNLHPFYNYFCEIGAVTISSGPTAYVDVQTMPEVPSDVPKNVSVSAVNGTTVWLTWNPPPPEHRNGIISGYSIRVAGINPSTAAFTELSTDQTAIAVGGLHPFYTYSFTVAARTIAIGPFSSSVPLQMPEAAPEASVQDVSVTVESPTSVFISWLPPPVDQWNGIITSYTVNYELLHAVGEQAENSILTPYSSLSVSIPQPGFPLANNPDPTRITLPLQTEMVLLEDLQEYYVYQFTVYLQNFAGRSEDSPSVTQQLPGAAPSGPPIRVAVEALSSASLRITWELPQRFERNGIIIGYEILLQSQNGSRLMYNTSGNTFSLQIEGLAKYAQYSISVAARSVYGVGPYSESVVRRTMEDIPSVPKEVISEVLNSTAVSLSWNPPDSPNGVILGYQITYYGYSNPEMIEVRQATPEIVDGPYVRNLTENSTVISGLRPELSYDFKIRARTSAGYGDNSTIVAVDLPAVDRSLDQQESASEGASETNTLILVLSVVAVVGWILLTVTVAVVVAVILWRRKHRTKSKNLSFRNPSGENEYSLETITYTNRDAELSSSTAKEHLEFQESDESIKDNETSYL